MEHFIADETYDKLVAALVNVEPCPVTGEIGPDQVKFVLGEIGDIWPARIQE